jgi:hypothetical protein
MIIIICPTFTFRNPFITGDFNSNTGTLNDYIEVDDSILDLFDIDTDLYDYMYDFQNLLNHVHLYSNRTQFLNWQYINYSVCRPPIVNDHNYLSYHYISKPFSVVFHDLTNFGNHT